MITEPTTKALALPDEEQFKVAHKEEVNAKGNY